MKTLFVIGLTAVVLAGCAPTPPSVEAKTPCEAASQTLHSPYANGAEKLLAVEYAKQHCFGPAPAQRVQIVR